MPSIVEYFNPRYKNHLIAYLHMEKFGEWPEWWKKTIMIKGLSFPVTWKQDLEYKMAHEWITSRLLASVYEDTVFGRYKFTKWVSAYEDRICR